MRVDPRCDHLFEWATLNARPADVQVPIPARPGGGAGGSSAINGQIEIRGMLAESDDWAQILAESTFRRLATENDIFALAMRRSRTESRGENAPGRANR